VLSEFCQILSTTYPVRITESHPIKLPRMYRRLQDIILSGLMPNGVYPLTRACLLVPSSFSDSKKKILRFLVIQSFSFFVMRMACPTPLVHTIATSHRIIVTEVCQYRCYRSQGFAIKRPHSFCWKIIENGQNLRRQSSN
jgi:hypothetical protein